MSSPPPSSRERSSSTWPSLGAPPASRARPSRVCSARLRRQLSGEAAAHLHKGATSQDVLDTAMMLVTRRALDLLIADLSAAADACASLVERHRGSIEPGRTLLQQALPLTFGLKAAGWLAGLDGALWPSCAGVRERELAVQFGGAVGTLGEPRRSGTRRRRRAGRSAGPAGARVAVAHGPTAAGADRLRARSRRSG